MRCAHVPAAGDNVYTAQHIARECGILTAGGVSLEGPAFRAMPDSELLGLMPDLQVGRGGTLCVHSASEPDRSA